MARHPGIALFLAAVATTGCEPPPVSDLLSLEFGSGDFAPPAEIDTNCDNGGCDSTFIEALLTFEEHSLYSNNAEVEILQYRVDYLLDTTTVEYQEPPFYANFTTVLTGMDETSTFNFRPAGNTQRGWVVQRFGNQTVEGSATLTIAGYDHTNEIVETDATFDISFGDFVDTVTTP